MNCPINTSAKNAETTGLLCMEAFSRAEMPTAFFWMMFRRTLGSELLRILLVNWNYEKFYYWRQFYMTKHKSKLNSQADSSSTLYGT